MLASELLKAAVVDGDGRPLGRVHDVRLERRGKGFRAVGIVIGHGPVASVAHAWGYAEGRASGPWLLRALLARGVRAACYVSAEDVAEWDVETVRLREGAELVHAAEAAP